MGPLVGLVLGLVYLKRPTKKVPALKKWLEAAHSSSTNSISGDMWKTLL